MNMNMDDIRGREAVDITMSYQGLTLTIKEVQALFRFEKMRRVAVMKEMKRMANIVANRGGKKDPVFNKPVKTQGPRKTTLPNPEEISDLNPSTRRWKNLYYMHGKSPLE